MEKLIAVKDPDNKTNEIILEKSDNQINEIIAIMEKLPDDKFSEEQIKYIMEKLIADNDLDNKLNEASEIMEKLSDDKFSKEQMNYINEAINNAAFEAKKQEQAQTNKDNSREQAIHTCRKDIPDIIKYSRELIEYINNAKLMV